MERPILYLSGAISGIPDLNKPKFAMAAKQLKDLGYFVINPHDICFDLPASEWNQCMRRCIAKLMDCDQVILLNDWQQSKGAQIEFTIAHQLHMKTIAIEDFLKMDHIYGD